mmetsp:Transcript_52031/g.96347  ORF Transcript_52031/g.96347 Transcript_52031/m.96347 type:complete len:440 (-) Transcript_52031:64-1383(-)
MWRSPRLVAALQLAVLLPCHGHNEFVAKDSDSDSKDVHGAPCSSITCPKGYVHIANAAETFCARNPCNAEADKDLCCRSKSEAEATLGTLAVESSKSQSEQQAPQQLQSASSTEWSLERQKSGCTNRGNILIGSSVEVQSAGDCGVRCNAQSDPQSACVAFAYASGAEHNCKAEGLMVNHCYMWSGECIATASSCLDQYTSVVPQSWTRAPNKVGDLCSTMKCPAGYKMTLDQSRRCVTSPCKPEVDVVECCLSTQQDPSLQSHTTVGPLRVVGMSTTTDMPWGWPWWAWFILCSICCLLCSVVGAACVALMPKPTLRRPRSQASKMLEGEMQYEREAPTSSLPARQVLVEEPRPLALPPPPRSVSAPPAPPPQAQSFSAPPQPMPIESSFSIPQKQAGPVWPNWGVQQPFVAGPPAVQYASVPVNDGMHYASPAWLYT